MKKPLASSRRPAPPVRPADGAATVLTLTPHAAGRGRAAEPGEDAVDETLVERAVRDLQALVVGGKIRILIEAGEYLIEHFYGGITEARSRSPRKAASLARLRERAPEFGMTTSDLPRAIGVALQARLIGRKVALRLRQEHHLALLPLRDPEEKRMLAATAVEENWTARHLKEKVSALQTRHPGGRPRDPEVLVLTRRLDRLLGDLDVRGVAASHAALGAKERRHVAARLRAAEVLMARLRQAIED